MRKQKYILSSIVFLVFAVVIAITVLGTKRATGAEGKCPVVAVINDPVQGEVSALTKGTGKCIAVADFIIAAYKNGEEPRIDFSKISPAELLAARQKIVNDYGLVPRADNKSAYLLLREKIGGTSMTKEARLNSKTEEEYRGFSKMVE